MTAPPVILVWVMALCIALPIAVAAAINAYGRAQEDAETCRAMGYPVAARFRASNALYCGHAEDGAVFVKARGR